MARLSAPSAGSVVVAELCCDYPCVETSNEKVQEVLTRSTVLLDCRRWRAHVRRRRREGDLLGQRLC